MKDCPPGAVFLAAVSGGADSMAMFAALCAVVCKERLFCLHVDHGLRGEEGKADAVFVRDFCEKQGIPCRIVSITPGKIESYARRKGVGIEAAARFFRRKALIKEAARLGDKTLILTAHTKDDALELALMRILRGAGPAGLAIMPVKKGRFLRPLLSTSRAAVITYLKDKNIPWREDSSNKEAGVFLRNKVRLRLIPFLKEFFPNWEKGLVGMAQTQSLAAEFFAHEAQRCISWEYAADSFVTSAQNFFAQPQIIREEAVFLGVNLFNNSSVPKRSVIRRFCSGSVDAVDLGAVRLRRENDKVTLSPIREEACESGFSLLIKEPGLYNLNDIHIEVCPASAQSVENGFFAVKPVVFRQSFNDDYVENMDRKINKKSLTDSRIISAVDRLGTAAFIGSKGILAKRELPGLCNCNEFSLLVVSIMKDWGR